MAEDYVIRIVGGDFEEGVKTSTSTGTSGFVKQAAGFSGIFKLADIILKPIVDAIDGILKPMMSVVTGIFKLMAEFLRPIVEVVVILLRPLLALLKPFLGLFKSYLAPFLSLARQISDLAVKQAAKGDIVGASMLSQTAVTTILGPFIVAITSVGLQMLITSVGGLLKTFSNYFYIAVAELAGIFSHELKTKILTMGADAGMIMDAIIETTNSGLQKGTQDALNLYLNNMKTYMKDVEMALGEQTKSAVGKVVDEMKTFSKSCNEVATEIANSRKKLKDSKNTQDSFGFVLASTKGSASYINGSFVERVV